MNPASVSEFGFWAGRLHVLRAGFQPEIAFAHASTSHQMSSPGLHRHVGSHMDQVIGDHPDGQRELHLIAIRADRGDTG